MARRTCRTTTSDDLVVIEESTPLDPGRIERKYYARGVGLVLEEATQMSDGVVTSRERTELVTRLPADTSLPVADTSLPVADASVPFRHAAVLPA